MRIPNSPFLPQLAPQIGSEPAAVDALLDVAATAEEHGRAILETCVSRWIEALDQAVEETANCRDPSQRRVHQRQVDAREALARLREWFGSQQLRN